MEAELQRYGRLVSPQVEGGRRQSARRPHQAKIGDLHVWTMKERVQAFLDGRAGIVIETVNVLLSVALVVIAIVNSYAEVGDPAEDYLHYSVFEIVSTGFFAVDYALHWYAAPDRLRFMVMPMGIIDLITILPTLLTIILTTLDMSGALPLLRIARIFRMLAVLRLYRVVQAYRGFDYLLGVLVFLILALIFVAAGIFQILEENYYTDQGLDPLMFHQAMYFVFVTLSTVGYGDISPHTTQGQFFVIFVIVVVVTVIPKQVTRLMELSALQHDYMHSYSLRRRSIHNGGHVIVTGHVRLENASAFLKEFYRPRQGRVNMDVVFLADHIPSSGLQAVLRNVRYRRRTTYLKGNLLDDRDAKRAHVAEAAAVFILANKGDPKRVETADAFSILQALAIDKFRFGARRESKQHGDQSDSREDCNDEGLADGVEAASDRAAYRPQSRRIRCFTEILSLKHTRGLRTITGVEVALNTSQLRMAILARNLVCPGATALLLNLIYSPAESHVAQGRRSRTPWVAEYAGGLQNLMFPVVLPAYFDGMLFENAAKKLYLHFHVMVIALYDRSAMARGDKSVRLAPFGEQLEENDLVFLIAPSSSVAKHAVDSLAERDAEPDHHIPFYDSNSSRVSLPAPAYATTAATAIPDQHFSGDKPTPVLVFSSDTVLDRQSFQTDRRLSLELDEVADGVEDGDVPATGEEVGTATDLPDLQEASARQDGDRRRLHGHILICGPFAQVQQLACYLDALYSREGSEERPAIVLLVQTVPSEEACAGELPADVFVERGASQNVEDLLRVRAFDASAVVLVPSNWEEGVGEGTSEDVNEHLQDYQVIMSTLSLRTMQELHHEHLRQKQAAARANGAFNGAPVELPTSSLRCSVVKSHASIKYFAYKIHGGLHALHGFHNSALEGNDGAPLIKEISDNPHDEYHDEHLHIHHGAYKPLGLLGWKLAMETRRRRARAEADRLLPPAFTPGYASGEVFVDCVLDTLLCQSFFNPYAVDVIGALAGAYSSDAAQSNPAPGDQKAFKASLMRYFSAVTLNASAAASLEGEKHEGEASVKPSHPKQHGFRRCPVLRTASLGSLLEGESFAEVFASALNQQVLVLGIYRRARAGGRGNVLPYVVTCPESPYSCRVERGDQLHVLTVRPSPVCIQ